jgi:hypothetical protein
MTKGIRRIIAVVLLIVVALLIGYSCHTSSRLANAPDSLDGYKRYIFRAKDGTMVAFTDESVWYGVGDEPLILLEINKYKEGVISMQREETIYEFVTIDEKTIYDTQTKELLIRRGDG